MYQQSHEAEGDKGITHNYQGSKSETEVICPQRWCPKRKTKSPRARERQSPQVEKVRLRGEGKRREEAISEQAVQASCRAEGSTQDEARHQSKERLV